MRKLFLVPILLFSLVACKKENPITETTEPVQDSTAASSPVESTSPALKEISMDQANELFKSKENDTLYVTNFFATWCGPCMKEIPHFKEKMSELNGKPVKFTFISLDDKSDWNDAVVNFGKENQLSDYIVLMDGASISPDFFAKNFKTWKGESIPFTLMKKGNLSDETVGSMSKEQLDSKIASLLK